MGLVKTSMLPWMREFERMVLILLLGLVREGGFWFLVVVFFS